MFTIDKQGGQFIYILYFHSIIIKQPYNHYRPFTTSLFRLWIPSLVCIFTLLGASIGNLSQSFFESFSGGSWLWLHPLISELSMARTLWSANAAPGWKLPSVPEMVSLKEERSGFYPHLYWPRSFSSQPQLPCARHPMLKSAHLLHPIFLHQLITCNQTK